MAIADLSGSLFINNGLRQVLRQVPHPMVHPYGIIGWAASKHHDHRNHRSESTTSGRTVPVHGPGGETVKDGGASVKSGMTDSLVKGREITLFK